MFSLRILALMTANIESFPICCYCYSHSILKYQLRILSAQDLFACSLAFYNTSF